jgi:membrane protein implicated in regulation of membrane protease activity
MLEIANSLQERFITMHPSFLWLIVGTGLCLVEFVLPTALISVFLGLGAIGIALLVLILPIPIPLQILLWVLLSGALAWLSQRFLPKRSAIDFSHTEAQSLTAITPGQAGRVLYEGASWRAKCGDDFSHIVPNQPLHVIGREGTTLLVVPMYQLDEH